MDDLLFASDSLTDLHNIANESLLLFKKRGFRLRKWVANGISKSILTNVPRCDLGCNVKEINLCSDVMPDSKALGLTWDVENDRLRMLSRRAKHDVSTRREMLSFLAGLFDPLGILGPCILEGKLILQEVAVAGLDWDDQLSDKVLHKWRKWVASAESFFDVSISRCCFVDGLASESSDGVEFQLHGFCDASDRALSCVIYLRHIVDGKNSLVFIQGKVKVVSMSQASWVISRKELEAAKMCAELMHSVSKSLQHLGCGLHFWSDSQVVLRWIVNPDLHLPKFVKRRVDKINLVSPVNAWRYVSTSNNPADVGTRVDVTKNRDAHSLWLNGPEFLKNDINLQSKDMITVQKTFVNKNPLLKEGTNCLDELISTSPDLYILKKRVAYIRAFTQYFTAKMRNTIFVKPTLDANFLDKALLDLIFYVQRSRFGAAIELLKKETPDAFEAIVKKLSDKATNTTEMNFISEVKSLRNLRPCVDSNSMFRVEGRLENSELPVDVKHPLILPGNHPLTRLVVLDKHDKAGHAGPAYTLMETRQRFWIIHGISNVKRILSDCSKCARRRATPVRQLMADLPQCRVTVTNKPYKFCGMDYLGPYMFRQSRSECKAWGLLFTCLCTRCIHVELVTSLDLNSFLLAFSRFTNLRGAVDTIFLDNGSTFCAAADKLPTLLGSTEFHNSLRKRNIIWSRIPPYAPSQAGSWESMVKLFKNALNRAMGEVRRKPSLIELQTFFSDAMRIVNDRPLTSVSCEPNDLTAISPSSFLGQQLSPNTPLSAFHDHGDLRRDYQYNVALAHKFWLAWIKGYLPTLQGRGKWRVTRQNLVPGQLVLVGDADDIAKRGAYRLGRIRAVHPQIKNGKEYVRRATVTVLKNDNGEIEHILRDISKIAPL